MDMLFTCDKCGQEMTIDSQYAGMETTCINCQADVIIPQPPPEEEEAPQEEYIPPKISQPLPEEEPQTTPPPKTTPPPSSGRFCPKCKAELSSEDAVICMSCGHNLKSGMNVKTAIALKKSGKFGLAVIVGAVVAVVCGLIWGGIGIAVDKEFGYVAVLVGFLTGGAMRLMNPIRRSAKMGIVAVVLAVVGIMLGKVILLEYAINHFEFEKEFSTSMENAQLDEEDYTEGLSRLMIEKGQYTDPNAELIKLAKNDSATDAQYLQAYESIEKVTAENTKKAQAQVAGLSEAQKKEVETHFRSAPYLGYLCYKMEKDGKLPNTYDFDYEDNDNTIEYKKALARHEATYAENMKQVREIYGKMTEEERASLRIETHTAFIPEIKSYARTQGFAASFEALDILFFVLAMVVAWRTATVENLLKDRY